MEFSLTRKKSREDKELRNQRILHLLQEVYGKTKHNAAYINMTTICKKYKVSNHVGRSLTRSEILTKIKAGIYKWASISAPDEVFVTKIVKECNKIQRSYYKKQQRKDKKAVKKQYNKESAVGLVLKPEKSLVGVIDRVTTGSYLDADFELLRCYISMGEQENALAALQKVSNKIANLMKKI